MSVFQKTKSLVLTSDKLFRIIVEELEKVFPAERCVNWVLLSATIAFMEKKGTLVLATPPHGRHKKLQAWVLVRGIVGNEVSLSIFFPLWGPICQQDEILRLYLSALGMVFEIEGGSIVVRVSLPFIPTEVKFRKNGNGPNGNGQKMFFCPSEEGTVEVS